MCFCEKNLYCIQLFWCTAKRDTVYAIYLVITMEIAQKWHMCYENQPQKFENLAMIGWLDPGNNLKASIICWWKT